MVSITHVSDVVFPGLTKVKSLVNQIATISDEYERASASREAWPVMDAMGSIGYGVGCYGKQSVEAAYSRVNLMFDGGKLVAIQFGNILVMDRGVPSVILGYVDIETFDAGYNSAPLEYEEKALYKPKANIKPLPLSGLVDLPLFVYNKQREVADVLFAVMTDLVLPKTAVPPAHQSGRIPGSTTSEAGFGLRRPATAFE
jgi:hypothetical protein